MKLVIGSDHAAFQAKTELLSFLREEGHDVIDVGPTSDERCNYPDFAIKLVKAMKNDNKLQGILLCGSGIGMSMVANSFKGIRAGLCRTPEEAKITKEHNSANVLCLGGRVSTKEEIRAMAKAWMEASFEGGRHQERLDLFNTLGE